MVTQWFNVILGAALGVVVTAIVAVTTWSIISLIGGEEATTIALLAALPIGIFAGGFVAGRTTLRSLFHGALTGVIMAGGVALYSIGSGGTASIPALVGLILGGLLVGAAGAGVAERRKRR